MPPPPYRLPPERRSTPRQLIRFSRDCQTPDRPETGHLWIILTKWSGAAGPAGSAKNQEVLRSVCTVPGYLRRRGRLAMLDLSLPIPARRPFPLRTVLACLTILASLVFWQIQSNWVRTDGVPDDLHAVMTYESMAGNNFLPSSNK